jgi:acyl-coenzyme A synthetase/AMP-(fatty) acid ligase
VVAFLEATELDVESLAAKMHTQLPPYMVPRDYRLVPQLPRSANRKVDRKALINILEEEKCRP